MRLNGNIDDQYFPLRPNLIFRQCEIAGCLHRTMGYNGSLKVVTYGCRLFFSESTTSEQISEISPRK